MKRKNEIIFVVICLGIVLIIAIPVVASNFEGIPVRPLKRTTEALQPIIENGTVIGGEVVKNNGFPASDETINALEEAHQRVKEEGDMNKAEKIIRSYSEERFDNFLQKIQKLSEQICTEEIEKLPIMKEYIDFVIEVYENKQMNDDEKVWVQEYLENIKNNFEQNVEIVKKIEEVLEQ